MKHSGLNELARMAGVSVTTAYRALNRHPYVSEKVRRGVFEAARKLNYLPPAAAQKKRIGVVVNNFDDPAMNFYRSRMLSELASQCGRRDIGLEIIPENNVELLEENFLRAAILFQSSFTRSRMKEVRNTRFVSVNALIPGIPCVTTDNVQSIRIGLEHLFRHGCRRIAVAVPFRTGDAVLALRQEEFRRFGGEHGLPCGDEMLIEVNPEVENNLRRVLHEQHADAIFAAGEDMLLQLNRLFYQFGIAVPRDISVIAFENYAAAYLAPPYTTVAQDFPRLVAHTVELADRILEGEEVPADYRELLPCSLIERASVRKK